MKKPIFTGVSTALITPFLGDKLNYPLVLQLIQRQLDAGITSITLAGTTGEAPTLSDEEKIELFRVAKDFVGNRCKIIAGTGTNNTKHTIALSQAAQDVGVDGLLVVSPYYNKANADGLYTHYASVSKSVDLPMIIYNVPSRTGVDIPVSVYKQLSTLENISGIKEASADMSKQLKTHAICGSGLSIWSGNDDQVVPTIALGGKGVISVLSNICPLEVNAMTQAALNGDFKSATALQRHLLELYELMFADINPIPVKFAMKCLGYDCGNCRLPLSTPSISLQNQIRAYLQSAKRAPE